MAPSKTLSIVIPAYNESAIIGRCLDAIAAQTRLPLEVVIVDNNSRDDTVAIARSYSFVKVLNVPEKGIVHARNAGFEAARGNIIARIDADTVVPADWVEHILHFYESDAHADWCITGGGTPYNVTNTGLARWALTFMAFQVNRRLLGHEILFGSNMAIPALVWRAVRADTCRRTDIHEDLDLAEHVARAGFHIQFDPTLHVTFRAARIIDDHRAHWHNLSWWWRGFREHGYRSWPLVYGLCIVAFLSGYPFSYIEKMAAMARRQRDVAWMTAE